MTSGWHAGIKQELLSGASARLLASLGAWSLGVCLGSLCFAVPLWLLHYTLWALPFYVLSAFALLMHQIIDPMESSRTQKEAGAGYTTLRHGSNDLDLADDRSRHVVRLANEVVSQSELRRRLRIVRGESVVQGQE